jgi:hypothetical protein
VGHRPHVLGSDVSDHGLLLRNAVEWALNEEPFVTVTGAGCARRDGVAAERVLTVHLVNLTNPMMMKGPFRELIPITRAESSLRPAARQESEEGTAAGGGKSVASRRVQRISGCHCADHSRTRGCGY